MPRFSTLQYQSADYDPTSLLRLYGGTQDNNIESSTNGGTTWNQVTLGDGGYTVVDPVHTNYVYSQYVNGSLKALFELRRDIHGDPTLRLFGWRLLQSLRHGARKR